MFLYRITFSIRRSLSPLPEGEVGKSSPDVAVTVFGHRTMTWRVSNECTPPVVLVSRKYAEPELKLEGYGGGFIMATQGVLARVQLPLIGCPLPGQTFPGGDSVCCGSRSQNNFNTPAGADLSAISPMANDSLMS